MVLLILEGLAHVAIHNRPLLALLCIKCCHWSTEVSFVSESISADWPEVRNHKMAFVELGEPATSVTLLNIKGELASTWDDQHFFGRNT